MADVVDALFVCRLEQGACCALKASMIAPDKPADLAMGSWICHSAWERHQAAVVNIASSVRRSSRRVPYRQNAPRRWA
ncbi:hypothetical protein [Pseudomonas sp. COR18]|uniref:hypothetical protein n=1 Tax=Pseudomonas sp. COR18 TaxID=3399680 RepID=UPI003AFF99A3